MDKAASRGSPFTPWATHSNSLGCSLVHGPAELRRSSKYCFGFQFQRAARLCYKMLIHLALLQWPELFPPHSNRTCPRTHCFAQHSSGHRGSHRSRIFFPSSWLQGSSTLHYLWCLSVKARSNAGSRSKKAFFFFFPQAKHAQYYHPERLHFILYTDNSFPWYVVCINTLFLFLPL